MKRAGAVPENRADALALVTAITKPRIILEVAHMIEATTGVVPDLEEGLEAGLVDAPHLEVDHLAGVTRGVHSVGRIQRKKKLLQTLSFEP